MRPLRRFIAFFMTSILFLGMLAAPQSLHAAAAQYHADEVIRVGLLFKKSSAQTTEGDNVNTLVAGEDNTTIGAKAYAAGGYQIGYYDGEKVFHTLYRVDTPFIAGAMDREMYVNGNDLYLPGSQPGTGRNTYIGAAHLQLEQSFADADSAKAVCEQLAAAISQNVFVAYIDGSYRVRLGDFPDEAAASAQKEALSSQCGYTLVPAPATQTTVTIIDMQNEFIVFEYDAGGENWPAVQAANEGQTMRNRGREYFGGFRFDRDSAAGASKASDKNPDKRIRLINFVAMQDYVKGVVPYEMSESWPLEALKAQAVCARTYAYHNLNGHTAGFDVCGTTCCQVYQGEYRAQSVTQAVDETYGQFLTYQGKTIQAVFTSSTGGYTESSENIWGSDYAYLQPVSIPGDADINRFSKTVEADALGRAYGIGTVTSIEVTYTMPAKTVYAVSLHGTNGDKTYTRGDNVRIGLSDYVESPHFTISGNESGENLPDLSGDRGRATTTVKGTSYTFAGAGMGHNVGMSQFGARALANDGWHYDQIVRYFYTGTEITSVGAPPEENPLPDPPADPTPAFFQVHIPEIEGASILPQSGCDPGKVAKNGDFRFQLVFEATYAQSVPVVKANGVILAKDDAGIYTISNIGEDQAITVEGMGINRFDVTVDGNAVVEGGSSHAYGTSVRVCYQQSGTAAFSGWEAEGIILNDGQKTNPELCFTMPNNAVHLTAVDTAEVLAAPQADLAAGTYDQAQQVALSAQDGARIYYTLDGGQPDEASTLYTGPITISKSCTLKARAFAGGYAASETLTQSYVIRMENPLAVSIADVTYGQPVTPVIDSNPAAAAVSYLYEGAGQTYYPASVQAPVNAGTYQVTAQTPATALYLPGKAEATFTIAPKPVTVIPTAGQGKTYGDAGTPISFTIDERTPLVGDDLLESTILTYSGSGIGQFEIVKSDTADASYPNYALSVTRGVTYEVSAKQLLMAFTALKEEQGVALRAVLTGMLDTLPDGTIHFYDGETEIGRAAVADVDGQIAAKYLWTDAVSGTHDLRAVYVPADGEPYTAPAARIPDFSIAKKEQAPLIVAEATTHDGEQRIEKQYGDPSFTLTTSGGSGTGVVSYQIDSGAQVADVQPATGTVTLKKPGSAVITVTKAADSTYNQATASVRIVVAKQRNTLVITCADTSYGTPADPREQTNLSQSSVHYYYEGTGETVYARSSQAPKQIGTYQVYGVSEATALYESAQSEPVIFAITKRPVQIKPRLGQEKNYGEKTPVLTYSLDQPLPYGESLNGQLLTVAEGEDAGLYPIKKAAGADENNPNYEISVKEGVNFAIRAKELVMTLSVSGKPVAGQNLVLQAELTGALNTSAPTGTVSFYDGEDLIAPPVSLEKEGDSYLARCIWLAPGAGEHDLKALYSPGNADNYTCAYPAVLTGFSLAKENQQALTVDGVSDGVMKRVYLDEPFSLAVHGGSGSGALTYQVLSGTDVATVQKHSGLLTIEKAGTAVIQVTKQTDEQYQMTSTRFSLQVAKAPGSLAISCDDLSYGAVPQAQICSQQGNGPVQYYYRGVGDTVYEESANAPLNAGSYEVYAIMAESENYLEASSPAVAFTIKQVAPVYPTGLKGDEGAPLSAITLAPGWRWDEPETLLSGEITGYPASYTDTAGNYQSVNGAMIPVGLYTYVHKSIGQENLGVNISGLLYENAVITVTGVEQTSPAYQAFAAACGEQYEVLQTRDISLSANRGQAFQGEINVRFEIGAAYNGQRVLVCHFTDDGLISEENIVVDGKVGIKATGLSPFAVLVKKNTAENEIVNRPDNAQTENSPGQTEFTGHSDSAVSGNNAPASGEQTPITTTPAAIDAGEDGGANSGSVASSADLGEAPQSAATPSSAAPAEKPGSTAMQVAKDTGMKNYAERQENQSVNTPLVVLSVLGALLLLTAVVLAIIRMRRSR